MFSRPTIYNPEPLQIGYRKSYGGFGTFEPVGLYLLALRAFFAP